MTRCHSLATRSSVAVIYCSSRLIGTVLSILTTGVEVYLLDLVRTFVKAELISVFEFDLKLTSVRFNCLVRYIP